MTINSIQGFRSVSHRGRIEDKNGVFYTWTEPGQCFNLPPGQYDVQGLISSAPITPYQKVKIPRHVFRVIPHGAGAWCDMRGKMPVIKMPEEAAYWHTPVYEFVYRHELGHATGLIKEPACDRYAAVSMLGAGYNPSQVYWAASILGFSPERLGLVRSFLRRNYAASDLRKPPAVSGAHGLAGIRPASANDPKNRRGNS